MTFYEMLKLSVWKTEDLTRYMEIRHLSIYLGYVGLEREAFYATRFNTAHAECFATSAIQGGARNTSCAPASASFSAQSPAQRPTKKP